MTLEVYQCNFLHCRTVILCPPAPNVITDPVETCPRCNSEMKRINCSLCGKDFQNEIQLSSEGEVMHPKCYKRYCDHLEFPDKE